MKGLDHQPRWVRRTVGIVAFLLLIGMGLVSPGDGILKVALWGLCVLLVIDALLSEWQHKPS